MPGISVRRRLSHYRYSRLGSDTPVSDLALWEVVRISGSWLVDHIVGLAVATKMVGKHKLRRREPLQMHTPIVAREPKVAATRGRPRTSSIEHIAHVVVVCGVSGVSTDFSGLDSSALDRLAALLRGLTPSGFPPVSSSSSPVLGLFQSSIRKCVLACGDE
ncbi:uncharacterized protein CC84DRAFT_129446 [Paraphaeosphaeria sporulosa]|uniref:Uncharacterized protein n=1 Tax=Paraphaeosphaeria sporulosa TaxID=1460663 RepID=A0A177D098_9PLEO|nr:uncharacterized protein CC84DRAFT_129446 [Paraphaeosphaeria sporulosa]OAG12592.1 hypothetical protein CC84DRAFT_129446 [Paraphaeosphaeria sporulosa]